MSSFTSSNQTQKNNTKNSQIKTSVAPEIIRALTPMFIALVGGTIGIALVFKPIEGGFTLASTALAGAAGLAQPGKEENRKRPQIEDASRDESA